MIGGAEKIIVTKDTTTIIGGEGKAQVIQDRVKQIEGEIANTTSSYDMEKLQERKAKLSGGVAVIRVGAPTEPAMKQKKQAFEDSLNSTRAAIEEGIVVGGSIAILRASKAVEKALKLSGEEAVGARMTFDACSAPFRRLIENSGCDSSVYLEDVLNQQDHFGFNAMTGKIEDLFKAGVRDPLKVVKRNGHA